MKKSCFTLSQGCSSWKAKPFKIASLLISSPLALAPMAGITHPVFREPVSSFGGCGLYFSEMLSARRSFVRELKSNLSIPVIGNGDIESALEVGKRFAETGYDGVMVGRFAVRSPWVFRACEDGKEPGVDRGALFLRFTERLCNFYEPKEALLKLKIFTSCYSKNFLYGHHLYTRIRNAKSIEEAAKASREFLRVNTSGENIKESEGAI